MLTKFLTQSNELLVYKLQSISKTKLKKIKHESNTLHTLCMLQTRIKSH